LAATKKALSSAELSRQLGISLPSAWLLRRKIMHAMSLKEDELMLQGIIELDDGFIGGRDSGGKRGRGAGRKTTVVVSAEETANGELALVHMKVIKDASGDSLHELRLRPFAREALWRPTVGRAIQALRSWVSLMPDMW
jgi:hypothetical protein